jgi:tRNA (guanine-N7-)-methyltransferase
MAQKYPASNFLGLERQRERVEKARKKIARHALANAEVLHGDGLEIVERLPDACADCVHVLFPDPWPKRRHQARRMVGREFLIEVLRILKVWGFLRLLTDDADYAEAITFQAARIPDYQRLENNRRDYPPTEFQMKFLGDSRPVYQLAFERSK